MPPTTTEPTLLDQLRDRRAVQVDEWDEFITARREARNEFEARADKTDDDETTWASDEEAFRAASQRHEQGIADTDEQIRQHEKVLVLRKASAESHRTHALEGVQSEPLTYNQGAASLHRTGNVSYFVDMTAKFCPGAGLDPTGAEERLQRHAMEMDVELPKRQAEIQRRADARITESEAQFRGSFAGLGPKASRGLDHSPWERRVNPNRTDGQGGYFVPPLWLPEYVAGLRAGRVAASLCRQMELPEGTDSINLPKLATLTQVGVQGSDNTGVTSQDYTDTAVTANVKTLAGQEDVAIQLLEQSPYHLDVVIMEDLMADYNRLVDRQVVYGNGTNSAALNGGQIQGIYPSTNWSPTNVITATEAGAGNGSQFPAIMGAMASQIAWNRYDLSNVSFLLHPRRWFWYATTLDTTGRPLVESSDFSPFNPGMINVDSVPAEGLAGRTPFGPNVYIDANVPTTDNGSGALTGTNDVAIAAKWDDLWLFEGEQRSRVLPEVLSGTLEVRFQVYNYVAFLARYGQSIAIAEGTYFGAPTGPTGLTSVIF